MGAVVKVVMALSTQRTFFNFVKEKYLKDRVFIQKMETATIPREQTIELIRIILYALSGLAGIAALILIWSS